jgi:putative N6-adenine-specific DNA methylase
VYPRNTRHGMNSTPRRPLDLFAVSAPGVEPLVAVELAELGIHGVAETGGVSWRGDLADVYRANLWLRTSARVLVRIAGFEARAFHELERHARRIPWDLYLPAGGRVRFRVSSGRSRLYHERAIEERLLEAVHRSTGAVAASHADEGQLVVVRVHRDRWTISADTSGANLHLRGYRTAVAKAPLRETLAAALLRAVDWRGERPLLDPLCGSGTIPIEAALLARRIAPGLANPGLLPRRFAFEDWPGHVSPEWDAVVEEARERVRPRAEVAIHGSDRDAGAVRAARSNAARAGVADDLRLEERPLSSAEVPGSPGVLLCNPPYGLRVGERAPLRDLYAALGHLARERLPGWTVAILAADAALAGQLRLPLEEALRTSNGGIPVKLLVARGTESPPPPDDPTGSSPTGGSA